MIDTYKQYNICDYKVYFYIIELTFNTFNMNSKIDFVAVKCFKLFNYILT